MHEIMVTTVLAIDSIRWSGMAKGQSDSRIPFARDFLLVTDHEHGRAVEMTTCRALQRMGVADLDETLDLAAAAESYARHVIHSPRISRVDLARDVQVPRMSECLFSAHLDRGALKVDIYHPPEGRGVTVQGLDWCDRIRFYDRGYKVSANQYVSDLWRVEVQLDRRHLPDNRRTIDNFRRDIPRLVTDQLDKFLLDHGLVGFVR